jgi:lysophospholipase L1-like esterase
VRLYKLIAVVLGLLLATLVAEVGLRVAGMGFGNSPMEPDDFLHHAHPKNYTYVQAHPSGELGGFEIEYDADGRVFRGSKVPPLVAPGTLPCRIAIMGDSFTEGGQVPFDASFAGLLESAARQKCEVRNYGTRSYSPAIYLVQWTRDVQPWKPDVVFLLLFGNDVREDYNYMKASTLDERGFPTAIHGPGGGWLFAQLRKLYVARFARMVGMRALWAYEHAGQEQWTVGGVVEENPDFLGATPELVKEIDRRVKAAGTRLVVMSVPSRYRLMGDGKIKVEGDFHKTVQDFTAASGIEFLDLFTPFERASKAGHQLFFRQDIHFNEAGHAVVAAAVVREYPEYFSNPADIAGPVVTAAYPDAPR